MKGTEHAPVKGRMNSLYVFISDEGGNDGILSAFIGDVALPLVTGNVELVKVLKPRARKTAALRNKRVKLVKFSMREDIEDIA